MLKKFFLIVFCFATVLFGQHILFTDDFDTGIDEWDVYATITTTTPPWAITSPGRGGAGSAVYQRDSNAGEELETWLVYGPFYVPNTGLTVDFYQRFVYYTYHRYAGVWISESSGIPEIGGGDFFEVHEIDSADIHSGDYFMWSPYSVDLSGYEHSNIYLAFRYWGIFASQWHIDDFELSCDELIPTTVSGNVNLVGLADNSDVTVYIAELGHSDITDFAGNYSFETFPGTFTLIADPANPFYAPETVMVEIPYGYETIVNFVIEITPVGFIVGYGDLTDITPGVCDPDIEIYLNIPGYETLTQADGGFIIESVREGDYVVFADYDGYHTASSAPITVVAGDTVNIDTLFLIFATEEIHFDDFEASDGGLTTSPIASGWEWGEPDYPDGPAAWSGSNVWGTVLDDDYGVNLADWHLRYDMSHFEQDIVSIDFYQWYDIEEGFDGGVIDISTDGGIGWERVEPTPGYDEMISSAFASPIGGQYAYTGASGGWIHTTIDLSGFETVTDIRFRFVTDNAYADFPGWYIDDLRLIGLTDGPMGAVDGYVYDNVDYNPVAGAMVYAGVGYVTYTNADGYFSLDEVPVGMKAISAHKGGYFPGERVANVNEYVGQTIYIPLTPIDIIPSAGAEASIAYGYEDSVLIFELCNPTSSDIDWWFAPWGEALSGSLLLRTAGDFSLPSLSETRQPMPYNTTISKDASPSFTDYSQSSLERSLEMGSVVNVFDIPTVDTPWGIGLQGTWDVRYFWVSDIVGGQRIRKHDATTGIYTGFYVDVEADITPINNLAADMTWDGEHIWAVMIVDLTGFGSFASRLYAFDPNTGAKVDSILDPDGVTGTGWGERGSWPNYKHSYGVAYDLVEDVFYIGGWNKNLLFKIQGKGWPNPGQVIGAPLFVPGGMAGIGFHSTRRTVWAGINGPSDRIIEIDYEAGTIVNDFGCPPYGSYSIAGLEIDGEGYIWYVSLTDEKVYVLDSGFRTLPGGVYFDPPYGTLAPDECVSIFVRTSGYTAHPGRYVFDAYISVDQMIDPHPIPFTLEVCPTIDRGWNMVSVPVNAIPNDPWAQLHDDIRPFTVSPTGSNIYKWDPVNGRYVVPTRFERGVGYYLWGWHNQTKYDVYGDEYTGDFAHSLTYYPGAALAGWQIIGNPFNRRIDWDKVVSDPAFYGIDETAWFFSSKEGWATYTPGLPPAGLSNEFDPWTSWWVKLNTTSAIIPFRENNTFESLAKKDDALPSHSVDFALRISVEASHGSTVLHSKWNYMGTATDASDGVIGDIFDREEIDFAPAGATMLNASFVNGTHRLKNEYKAPLIAGDSKIWTMNIADLPVGSNVRLYWPLNNSGDPRDGSIGTADFDEEYSFTAIHPTTGELVDMREASSISFTYNGSVDIDFIVTLSYLETGEEQPTVPKEFSLSQNTPNPFNAKTGFSITVAEETSLSLNIYDIRGNLVSSVVDNVIVPAGVHYYTWDASNDYGQEVSSGIYIYKAITNDFEESRKMIYIK